MKHPHVVVVLDDQHRYSALGANGDTVVRSPNLDRLAGQGMVCDQVFSCSPICAPYRAQLFTGRYAHKNGVVDNEYKMRADQITLSQAFKNAGYHTGYVGKWHLGCPPYTADKRYGFDTMAANNAEHEYYETRYFENERGPIAIDGWAPEEETAIAIRFLEQHRRDQPETPLFLTLSWAPPHSPYTQYPEVYDIYDSAEIVLRPNVPERMAAFARWEIAQYYGNVTALDAQFGRLMDALDRLEMTRDSLLIFTSDHGDHLSSHGYGKEADAGDHVPIWRDDDDRPMHHSLLASKGTPYEESIHVPFVARFPGRVAEGVRTAVLMGSVDIMPTVLRLCDLEVPAGVQGRDLSHVFLGRDGPLADSVFLQILGPGWPNRGDWVGLWRGVRNDRWTYARWHRNEYGPWLFDRENDPYEMTNLAGRAVFAEVQRGLEARLRQWMEETDDPFDTGPRDPLTGMLELGQEFTHEMHLNPGAGDQP